MTSPVGEIRFEQGEPGIGLPCFWSATILMTLHWLSAAVMASLWFDFPCLSSSVEFKYHYVTIMTSLIGFQVAFWIGHAEYIAISRQLGMNQWWMGFWTLLFLGGLWQVPIRIAEDVVPPFDDASFLAALTPSYMLAIVLLTVFFICQLPTLLWFIQTKRLEKLWRAGLIEKLWRVELIPRFSIRGILWITSFIALILFAELQWMLVSGLWGFWAFVAFIFLSVLVKLSAMEQLRAWKANTIHIVFWILTGILVYVIWNELYPGFFYVSLGQQVLEALEFLLFGYFFGRLLILVVRAADSFPPTLGREFLEGRISRRAVSGRRALVLVLLILGGTQLAWSQFSGRYQPSVLICSTEKAWERARIVARSSQLHRAVQLDEVFTVAVRGRFFMFLDDSLYLAVAKEVARDARWLSLERESDAADLNITWMHVYPQDNLAFFEPPHFSVFVDLDAIHPGSNEWRLMLKKDKLISRTIVLYGGHWTDDMVEAIQADKFRSLSLLEPSFDPKFSPDTFEQFERVSIHCRSVDAIVDQPQLYLAMILNGVDIMLEEENDESVRQQLLQVPELDGQIDVVKTNEGMLELKPKVVVKTAPTRDSTDQ